MKKQIAIFFTLLAAMSCSGSRKLLIEAPQTTLKPLPIEWTKEVEAPDPLAEKQWSLQKIGLKTLPPKDVTEGSRRVTVAVLSTGVDYNHEDLRANVLINLNENVLRAPGDATPLDRVDNDQNGYVDDIVGWDAVDDDGLAFDSIGSGTAIAGIIGAAVDNGKGIRGINAQVSLLPVRYIGPNGQANVPTLIKALTYAEKARPDTVVIHLANLQFSMGIPEIASAEERGLRQVLKLFADQGTPIIVSAGNSGSDVSVQRPVLALLNEFTNIFIVTSVDQNDKRPFMANYGMRIVDTAAPGESVLSTLPGNKYGEEENGTHIAAAHVAGALALGFSKHYGRVTVQQLYKILLSEAASDALPEMAFETGGGNRLNIAKFLKALD